MQKISICRRSDLSSKLRTSLRVALRRFRRSPASSVSTEHRVGDNVALGALDGRRTGVHDDHGGPQFPFTEAVSFHVSWN